MCVLKIKNERKKINIVIFFLKVKGDYKLLLLVYIPHMCYHGVKIYTRLNLLTYICILYLNEGAGDHLRLVLNQ